MAAGDVFVWAGVTVKMQSVLGTALTLSAITKANPGVVSYTGTDPVAGDIVRLDVEGMHQVSGRPFRVGTVDGTANTFQLEGENTTDYATFVSGTSTPVTLGITLLSAQSITATGGEAEQIDITTIHNKQRRTRPGSVSAGLFNFTCFWNPDDPALAAMKVASDSGAQRAFSIEFEGGASVFFAGYVSASMLPTGAAQDVVTTAVTISMAGSASAYGS